MTHRERQAAKQAVAREAAGLVENGMIIGLGTGSTTKLALERLGARMQEEGLEVAGVPTSPAAERAARSLGIPLRTLDDVEQLDLALDGADEVDPELNLIKGRGAAHTREKVIASQARRFVALVDPSKEVDRLGTEKPLPVEVVPMAVRPVMDRVAALGAETELRTGEKKDGPVVTDQGLWVIDASFPDGIADPHRVDEALLRQPGVLDHGLFLGLAATVLVGTPEGGVRRRSR